MRLRLEFDPRSPPNVMSSGASIRSERRTVSIVAPSRFSLRGRRPNDNNDDSN